MQTLNNQYLLSPLNIKGVIFKTRVFKSSDSGIEADLSARIANRCDILSDRDRVSLIPEEDLLKIPKMYAQEALNAREEGCKVCVIHGETGTFLGDFISPRKNDRTDQWGGSFENRMRLVLDIIEKIQEAIGNELVLEFCMSGAEFISDGYSVEEGVEIAKALDQKVDIIYVAAGVDAVKDPFNKKYPSLGIMHGSNIRLASEIKKNVSALIATIGGLGDLKMMNDIIAVGKADILYSDVLF
ncbi:MAG: hypothetical protein HFI37_08720 [Lachnospiraceae bacterium]|nr:hypothetical protein [Lachnospiraceae bacterium]